MAQTRESPYIWVTWLTKLLVGENSCEWAAWFHAQHESWSYDKVPSTFDATEWQMKHTALLNETRGQLEAEGKTVFTEGQNAFTLRGRSAALGGKPDLITVSGDRGLIIDTKTGKPLASHHVQVMLYMYGVPRGLQRYRGVKFDGRLVYADSEDVDIPNSAVDDTFVTNFSDLIKRVSSTTPARRVPSKIECGFCNITRSDCPERAVEDVMSEGETEDF